MNSLMDDTIREDTDFKQYFKTYGLLEIEQDDKVEE